MRRLAAIVLGILGLAAVGVVSAAGGDEDVYRVDAIFDNTAGLIPGQDVKIAGARVGTVKDIGLTPERRARVQMEIRTGFAPFRSDGRCAIRPQSLIGEKFVQCDPGTPAAPALAATTGAPTLPLERNSSPVDIDLVFATLRRPFRERLSILVTELGSGLAGRPEDLSDAILRANPALREANEVLAILDRDREALGRLVERSDLVLAQVAAKDREAGELIERTATFTRALADRRGDLDETLRRLPPLLEELEPSAAALERLSRDARPVVADLRAASPALTALLADLDPLADAARPALVALSETARIGRRAVRSARPVARRLRPLAAELPPVVETVARLVESLRDTGTVEGIQLFVFHAANSLARFDRLSHILPSYQIASSCQQYSPTPVEGCSAHFGDGPEAASLQRRRGPERSRATPDRRRAASPEMPVPREEGGRRPRPPRRVGGVEVPELPVDRRIEEPVERLLDFLLGDEP